jgi:hypothetical protein
MNIKDLPGFNEVSDLISDGNFSKYTRVWSAKSVQTLTVDGDLVDALFILLADDYHDPKGDMIEIGCLKPKIIKWPDKQIVGMIIKYYDMAKTHGWDKNYFEITDYENGDVEIKCSAIKLKRVLKQDGILDYRDWV